MTTTPQPTFTVRPMKQEEVPLIREWADAEGWNPGTHDGDCFYHADPGGFFLGELNGEPVACISCVAYDDSFGFLGHGPAAIEVTQHQLVKFAHAATATPAQPPRVGCRQLRFHGAATSTA